NCNNQGCQFFRPQVEMINGSPGIDDQFRFLYLHGKNFYKILRFSRINLSNLLVIIQKYPTFAPVPNKWFRGRVARLSSAKAPTAVRIRSEPLFIIVFCLVNELIIPDKYSHSSFSDQIILQTSYAEFRLTLQD